MLTGVYSLGQPVATGPASWVDEYGTESRSDRVVSGTLNLRERIPEAMSVAPGRSVLSCTANVDLSRGLDPVATAPGSVFVRRRVSLSLKVLQCTPDQNPARWLCKQKVWHRGSMNTEPGAVATGLLTWDSSWLARISVAP